MLKNRWRLKGIIVFGLFAIMEIGDLVGLLGGFSNPELYARSIGVSTQVELVRLVVLSIMAGGIVVSSLFCILGLLRRKSWVRLASGMAAVFFVLYGAFQIYSAFFHIQQNKAAVIFAGAIFILLGTVCDWLGRQARAEIATSARAQPKS